ncbi:hypothetical protein TSAR_005136 [Trichomalopsis sarcophagae]|uniref:Uncharacterized protein n=1 Tax=Trichomalopsis sarcophagae TaxID=543379 RepID=A0A232EHC9_9HYME|nr:hypothetical protein TSAR_005136 [Trichomalopsis sarcophagae]
MDDKSRGKSGNTKLYFPIHNSNTKYNCSEDTVKSRIKDTVKSLIKVWLQKSGDSIRSENKKAERLKH